LLVFLGQADRSADYVRAFFRLLETRPWCRYEGFVDRNGLKRWLRQAALLVLPSLADNCPMVVLEAAAAGVPVAAAKIGGVPELIAPDQTGLLFDPADNASMAAAVTTLLKSEGPSQGAISPADHRSQAFGDLHRSC
jgi:glycosyltransferase involved in cell wall biosynthesis